jgi:hypothetical protein|tara:strand:- start:225 stop:464 length:240 start_codon:yes stop_codon:yes gene_type:complete
MNKATLQANARALFEYDQEQVQDDMTERKKLTLRLERSYHDLMQRLAIVEGSSRTSIIRRALDHYSKQYPDQVLFPQAK